MQFRTFELDSADDMQALPSHVKWVREGLLIIGLDTEMQVYSQWSTNSKSSLGELPPIITEDGISVNKSRAESEEKESNKSMTNKSNNLIVRKNHSVLDLHKLHKMTKDPTHAKKMTNLGDDLENTNNTYNKNNREKESLNEMPSWNSKTRGDSIIENDANKSRKFDQSEMLEIIQDNGLFMQAK